MLTTSLLGRDLLRISDLSADEAIHLLDLAVELREQPKQPLLAGASLGLYFAKHSTRTRVSSGVSGIAASRCPTRRARSRATSTRTRFARTRTRSWTRGRSGRPSR